MNIFWLNTYLCFSFLSDKPILKFHFNTPEQLILNNEFPQYCINKKIPSDHMSQGYPRLKKRLNVRSLNTAQLKWNMHFVLALFQLEWLRLREFKIFLKF